MNRLEEIKARLKNKYESLRLETELEDMEYLLSAYQSLEQKLAEAIKTLEEIEDTSCEAYDHTKLVRDTLSKLKSEGDL